MRKLVLMVCAVLFAVPVQAQVAGRWGLGNPALHIDLPGEPSPADVAWDESNSWLLTANAWRATGNGATLEAARFFNAGKSAEQILDSIEAKTGAVGAREIGEVSKRRFVIAQNATRLVGAIEAAPGVPGSSAWGIVIEGNAQNARSLWNSIEMEREGSGKITMRALGSTKLVAELPFELALSLRSASARQRRYEASWDGMDVEIAVDQSAGEGKRWDTKTSLSSYIEDVRTRPKVSSFKAERTGIKFGKLTGEMGTLTFKQGTRDYKVFKVITFSGQEGYSIELAIDPKRADHILSVARFLETIRTTEIPAWGWKTASLGAVTVDSPATFTQSKKGATLTEWDSSAAAMPITVREVVLENAMTNPDVAAAQTQGFMKLLPGMANAVHAGTHKRIVDGLPARQVDFTWKNGNFNNWRSQLFIYGATRTWVVDAIGADNYREWRTRLFETVRVNVPSEGKRQRIGGIGATFRFGTAPIETTPIPPPAPAIKAAVQSIIKFPDGGLAAVIDQTMAEDGQVVPSQVASFYESFSKPLNAAGPTESHEIAIDGARGYHARGKAIVGAGQKDVDFVMLARGKSLFIAFIASDPNSSIDRAARDEMLNTLRF